MAFLIRLLSLRSCGPLLAFTMLAGMAVDTATAREGPHARRAAAPRVVADHRGARQAERAQQRAVQQQAPEHPVDPAPIPVESQPPPERAKPGRLTPDERRALRQQINDAGREIYRPDRP